MIRKRLFKLIVLALALAPVAEAFAIRENFWTFTSNARELPGWAWSTHSDALTVSADDFSVALTNAPPASTCELQVEGPQVKNNLHRRELPATAYAGCDPLVAKYINTTDEVRTIKCAVAPTSFGNVDVVFAQDFAICP
jgi:hypothetical protein